MLNQNLEIMKKTIEFSDEDCLAKPTFVQEQVEANHEDIGGYTDVKYYKDGVTVLFKCSDAWVAVKPQNPFIAMGGSENGISMSQINAHIEKNRKLKSEGKLDMSKHPQQ